MEKRQTKYKKNYIMLKFGIKKRVQNHYTNMAKNKQKKDLKC